MNQPHTEAELEAHTRQGRERMAIVVFIDVRFPAAFRILICGREDLPAIDPESKRFTETETETEKN